MKKYNIQNLKRLTSEEAREYGRRGGKKSVQSRRERKLISQIYAQFLAKKHDIVLKNGKRGKIDGYKMLENVMTKILARGDTASVSMMKEIREATEGQKHVMDGGIPLKILYEPVKNKNK